MPSCILDYCALRDAKVLFIAYRSWVRLEVGNKTPKKKAKNTKQVGPMRKIWIAASFTSPHQRWANLQQFETMKCDWALQPLPLPHDVVIDVSQKSKERKRKKKNLQVWLSSVVELCLLPTGSPHILY